MRPWYSRVVMGGTFDTVHAGHIKLLTTALLLGREVHIGVTSDEFARTYKRYRVKPFEVRAANIRQLARLIAPDRKVHIHRIDDPYGPAVTDPTLEAIVASIETYGRALEINELRARRGLRPMHVVVVTMVRDGYGNVLSSTFIRERLGDVGV